MESTSVLQIMDQVGLWRVEKKNFMYYMQIISMSTYILLSWKCKTCQRTPPRRSLSLGKSSFLERHSFWSWRRGPEASIFKTSSWKNSRRFTCWTNSWCLQALWQHIFGWTLSPLVDKNNYNSPRYETMMNTIIWKSSNTKNSFRIFLPLMIKKERKVSKLTFILLPNSFTMLHK